MTAASASATSPSSGSVVTVGRNIYDEGNRTVARFQVTLKDLYATGGVAFDFATVGVTFPIAEVRFSPHVLLANVLLTRYFPSYDFVNKKIMLFDTVDGDEPNTDDITGLIFDVEVVSE